MNRLLHAAARGARIGWKPFSGKWHPALSLTGVQSDFGRDAYRIHPEDEHLAYGPVSTALREMAEHARAEIQPSWEMGLANFSANNFIDYYDWRWCEPDYPLFYLILAEFLADEGM